MADIDVATPFTLTLDDGSVMQFKPGPQTVGDDVAAHWYVRAHLVGYIPAPPPGSVAALRLAGQAKAQAAQADADAQAAEATKAAADAQAQAQADLQAATATAVVTGAEAAAKVASAPAVKAAK